MCYEADHFLTLSLYLYEYKIVDILQKHLSAWQRSTVVEIIFELFHHIYDIDTSKKGIKLSLAFNSEIVVEIVTCQIWKTLGCEFNSVLPIN